MILFEDFVLDNKAPFLTKVKAISNVLEIQPNWLMTVMFLESGLDPQVVGKTDGSGLLQLSPVVLVKMGISPEKYRQMNNVDQLDAIAAYLNTYKGQIKNWIDLYLAAFYPRALAKPLDFIIGSDISSARASIIGKENKQFDFNEDGVITVGDFNQSLKNKLNEVHKVVTTQVNKAKSEKVKSPLKTALIILSILGIGAGALAAKNLK